MAQIMGSTGRRVASCGMTSKTRRADCMGSKAVRAQRMAAMGWKPVTAPAERPTQPTAAVAAASKCSMEPTTPARASAAPAPQGLGYPSRSKRHIGQRWSPEFPSFSFAWTRSLSSERRRRT
jgi:hypothetical protein